MDLEMNCNICKSDVKEILVLRKHKFTKKGSGRKKVHRVCFSCARMLISRREYDFGKYWRGVFFYQYEVRK